MRRRHNHIGRVRVKLATMLEAAMREYAKLPVEIHPEDFWIQEGAYRHATWDLARWGCDLKHTGGHWWKIYSWDTMTSCARYGFKVEKDNSPGASHWEIQVYSNQP